MYIIVQITVQGLSLHLPEFFSHILQILKRFVHSFPIRIDEIGDPMLLRESSHPVVNPGMSELGHGWEQMMFDLVVQITHPPVAPRSLLNIRSVKESILHPMGWLLGHRQVAVGECKVPEEID